ncbi:hypothetical protein CVT24_009558 [Panaeolus cyanescens]|uniref:Uncharacterized protein n=1 Tax=Panaeolus cyanescens TaxID=181874 RepID=A0A409YAF9_9AGAR|nr:hypothetical protein CVT24_009558 [Panaeolus cyanescens]
MAQFKSLVTLTFLAVAVPLCNGIAITCTTTTTTLEALINCLNAYTVPENAYSCTGYSTAQPQISPTNELFGWSLAVNNLLNAAGSCSLPAGSTISGSYQVTDFLDTASGRRYCVLSEKDYVTVGSSNRFSRGWGTFVAPRDVTAATLTVHHSSPHPFADTNTPQQAAAIFRRTNSRSLLIAGRHRDALSAIFAPSPCAINSCVSSSYTKTDPAHEIGEPFHIAMSVVRNWQNAQTGGCPSATCGYVQWHGKGSSSCAADNVFMSSGLATGSCYSSSSLPINRIKAQLNSVFPTGTHATPADDPVCTLTATRNLFGRIVNNVPAASVCTTAASSSGCGGANFGQFVHIEQESAYRNSVNYNNWANVITNAF